IFYWCLVLGPRGRFYGLGCCVSDRDVMSPVFLTSSAWTWLSRLFPSIGWSRDWWGCHVYRRYHYPRRNSPPLARAGAWPLVVDQRRRCDLSAVHVVIATG